jgi:alpha-galactosidase
VSADPGAAKGAKVAVYAGAYDAKADYAKLTPARTATVALGTVAEKLPAMDGPHTVVVSAFIDVPASGNYTVHAGFEDSTHSVATLDGKEVYRKGLGGQPEITKVALETGKRYPVTITYFTGGSAAFWLEQVDLEGKGDLETVTKKDKKFTYLLDDAGKWSVRNDVSYTDPRLFPTRASSPLSATSNNGKTIGPELGFGAVMGTFHDEQTLLIKASMGNRSLGFDFRPPSSGRTQPTNQWESLEYKLMVEGVRKTLDQIDKIVPGYAGQGYEIAGFAWFQGHKDKGDPKEEYEKHLVNLINDLRKEFKTPKMPVVVATVGFNGYRIEEGPWKGVWEAQMAVGDSKQHPEFAGTVASVDTRDFWCEVEESPTSEDYHYNRNAETYLLVGEAMGRAMVGLQGGRAEPIPLSGRKQKAAPAVAPQPDEAAKAAAAKAAQKALKPIITDGMLRTFVTDARNKAALLAALKGEKPANVSQFLRDAVDSLNYFYGTAGVQDYEWHAFGPDMNNVEWAYFSFDPPETLDKTKGAGRYRKVTYPEGMANWFAPEFDAAKAGWKKGLPPFGQKDGKLEPLGGCTNDPCLCGVTPRTLWEKEVLLIRGTFDLPPFKPGYRYRFVVGGSNHVRSGEGYAIYVNGKLLAESKSGVPNRAGGQPRGGHVYAGMRGEFKGGKVTVAATSFLQFNRRGAEGRPVGHLTLWLEEQKLPPAE